MTLTGCQTAEGLHARVPSGSGLNICADYDSTLACSFLRYAVPHRHIYAHRGMDFGAPAGTEVISATHGSVVSVQGSECAGGSIIVKTDIRENHPEVGANSPVFAIYAHIDPIKDFPEFHKLKPGDLIGRITSLKFQHEDCIGTVEHVHYELRVNNINDWHINPNKYWADGPGNVTCYRPGMKVPAGKTIAPIRCNSKKDFR